MMNLSDLKTEALIEELKRRGDMDAHLDCLASRNDQRAGVIRLMRTMCVDVRPVSGDLLATERSQRGDLHVSGWKFKQHVPEIDTDNVVVSAIRGKMSRGFENVMTAMFNSRSQLIEVEYAGPDQAKDQEKIRTSLIDDD